MKSPLPADYAPWGKGVGAPERDASGKIIKRGILSAPACDFLSLTRRDGI